MAGFINMQSFSFFVIHDQIIEFFKDVDEEDVNTRRDFQGRFAIHMAASIGNNLPEVKRLLSIGADIESKNKFGCTPLHHAAYHNRGNSHFDMIKLLLESGAEVNSKSHDGMTPLHNLTLESNVEVVKLLLDFGADVNVKENRGDTPLSYAIFFRSQNYDVFKLLLDFGSDVNNFGNQNMTPLQYACAFSGFKLVKFLVKNGADVSALDSKGRTPLMMVLDFYGDSADWLKFLIKYSDVNTIDLAGNNILCFREFEENKKIVWKIILEHVAKLQALDLPIHQKLHEIISNRAEYREYFKKCTDELMLAKSTKFKNCWITYFNLLLDSKRKIKNYAGNRDLVQNFKNKYRLKKFPIYGAEMIKKRNKGIETRESFDKSTVELSYCLPIFSPAHLIIKDVLDFLIFKDYNRLTT